MVAISARLGAGLGDAVGAVARTLERARTATAAVAAAEAEALTAAGVAEVAAVEVDEAPASAVASAVVIETSQRKGVGTTVLCVVRVGALRPG